MEENKTEGQNLSDKLSYTKKFAWETTTLEQQKEAFAFCEGYKLFLDEAKTERECANEVEKLATKHGFVSIDSLLKSKTKIIPGMKIYEVNREKAVILCVIGTKPLEEGIQLIGAHIDAPRIDLKQNPVYEDTGLSMLKTHYYGGIKKYQWLTIPLALHGVFIKENGEKVIVNIGEDEKDCVFTITDLLPHLAAEQMQKKMSEAITGEGLNLLFGSIPYQDEKVKEKVKLNILNLLHEKYGIIEEDFVSAELEIVPAFKSKDIGFDRSMVGAYGQDDRSCAYPAFKAILELEQIEHTAICVLTDKEEVGSMGNTGAQSRFLENFVSLLCAYSTEKEERYHYIRCLSNSKMISADVNAGVDPNYEGVQDKKNASYLGKGIVLQKYGGSRGKAGSSDANPEFISQLRKLFNENDIPWQASELGKVDLGGGGTIAQFMANLGIDVIDCGVSVLSMHSPFEITSKIDIHALYKGFLAFYKA